MSVTETKNIPYAQGVVVRADGALTITQTDKNGIVWTMFECGEDGTEGSESGFTSITNSMQITREEGVHYTVTPTFSRGSSRGAAAAGNPGSTINSDLVIGRWAADAVSAVCTLTLGDLAKGGTLTDSNGQSVELENPHAYATGQVDIADATAAGTIAFGEHEAIEFEAKAAANASCNLIDEAGTWAQEPIQLRSLADPENPAGEYVVLWEAEGSFNTEEEFLAAFNSEQDFAEAEIVLTEETGYFHITAKGDYAGAEGNRLVVTNGVEYYTAQLAGGVDARTPQDVVDALNASEDCPAIATLDADEDGISFTAKEYGVNDAIVVTGSLFSDEMGMSGGHGDYTVAELVTAISGEFSDITPAAGEAEGTITLTATTAGKAANTITYTATGCFGSGITRQGSTTRGKDAVEQTDYKIYLNGEEFTGGGAPIAPVPEPLGTTTTLKHGHVYTLAVSANTDLSALGVELYGTAELWIDYTAGSVTWPQLWSWVDGIVPTFTAGTRYFVRVWSDGVAVIAELKYSYANA